MQWVEVPSTTPEFEALRSMYLNELGEPQDMYSESLVRRGRCYLLMRPEGVAGYMIVADSATLVEFWVVDSSLAADVLRNAQREFSLQTLLCKTFDQGLMATCSALNLKTEVEGFLFSEVADLQFVPRQSIAIRLATIDDFDRAWTINDHFFDDQAELTMYIEAGNLWIYEEDGELLGCGVLQRAIASRPNYDVGMLVSPHHRRRGIGEYIVRHLKSDCAAMGGRPVCGCGVDNLASKACLEAAGFRSRHQLLRADLPQIGP